MHTRMLAQRDAEKEREESISSLQPTRLNEGCFPWRSVRAAELGR
jgi:hypothetical protein